MTNNDIIRKIGRVLYGENWMRPLSRALECDEKQVRRWGNDEAQARNRIVERCFDLLLDHESQVQHAVKEIIAQIKSPPGADL